jgi:hypothetical protein
VKTLSLLRRVLDLEFGTRSLAASFDANLFAAVRVGFLRFIVSQRLQFALRRQSPADGSQGHALRTVDLGVSQLALLVPQLLP